MSVVIETTLGDITVDLFVEQRPTTCLNFLKLCKMKYYNFNLFHTIQSGFIAQTGDPSGERNGGESIFGLIEGPNKRFFSGERMPKIRHTDTGLLSMVSTGDLMIGSQFFFTLGTDLDSLDGVHCVIGTVTEGHEVLRKLNDVICDESHRPYQDVRITHTVILEDPFHDPVGMKAPSRSPSPSIERLKGGRIAPDEELDETAGKSAQEIQEMIEEKEAKARATILEIVGDLPDADVAPPENVLFVCKLNPVTTDEDLEIIFSRFGKIVGCEVIRDKKTGDSLQYAFVEFEDKKSCEDAYFKMDNVLIDDRRIHVDFSQSVSKMRWFGKGKGLKHFDGNSKDNSTSTNNYNSKRKENKERVSETNHDSHNRRKRESRRTRSRSRSPVNKKSREHRDSSRSRSSRDHKHSHSKSKYSERSSDSRRRERQDRRRVSESPPRNLERRRQNNLKESFYTSSEEVAKKLEKNKEYSNKNGDDTNKKDKTVDNERSSKYKNEHSNPKLVDSKSLKENHTESENIIKDKQNHYDSLKKDANTHKLKDKKEEKSIIREINKSKSNDKDRDKTKDESNEKQDKYCSNKLKKTASSDKAEHKSKPSKQSEMSKKSSKERLTKKTKRVSSTSSSSSSETSSSSDTSSSSSDSDAKSKKRRKRKVSSSTTTTSSSSSSSDSSSSSSESDSDPPKRKKAKVLKKKLKKPKKK